jgi:energy-coupling factor transporter ATP-binding protein EcfA2
MTNANAGMVYKAIKSAHTDSKGPPVLVFLAGGLKSGKTTLANQLKTLCNKDSLKVIIVEQNPHCNKSPSDFTNSLASAWSLNKSSEEIKLDSEISMKTSEINKLSNKLKDHNSDTEKYEELSQVQINLNTQLIALKNRRTELAAASTSVVYKYDVIILDRTQIYTAHRNTVTEIYTSLFKKAYTTDKCIGVNMVTSLETCIARIPKNNNYDNTVKFMTTLHKGFEEDRITVDQGYAYVFDVDGYTPNTTELKTVPRKPPLRRTPTQSGGGGGGGGGGSSVNVWKARKPSDTVAATTATKAEEVTDETPFDPMHLAPDTAVNTTPAKMEGFVLALDKVQRTGILATLKNYKGQGILGEDALKHPIMHCVGVSCRRTTKTLTRESFVGVPMPGTKVSVTFSAYVCDNKLGCLIGHVNDMKNFVSGRTFLPIDLSLGNNGNASEMLKNESGTRYPIDPITIEMTVGIVIRNPDLTTDTVFDVREIAANMFEILH